MRKTKVLIINKLYYPWIGGVEKHVQDLAENLVPFEDLDLTVLVINETEKAQTEIINGVKVIKLSNLVYRLFKKTVMFSTPINLGIPYQLLKNKADILHFHLPNPLAVFSYFLTRPKGQVIITWHSDIIKQKKFLYFYKHLEHWFLRRAKAILTTSPNMIKHSPFLQPYADKCHIVPLGINPEKLELSDSDIAEVASQKDQQKTKQLLFVGRLIYYKGVDILVEAMQSIDAQLTIIGDGKLKAELEAKIVKLRLSDKITIIPPVDNHNLAKHYHLCDIFVLPSVAPSEAFGIVQLEAMACGKPVVSTNLPTGVPFVNQHLRTGLIVEPGDIQGLAMAINQLLGDDLFRAELGKYAKDRVLKEFTNVRVGAQVHGIYKDVVDRS
ncbi:MAG: glycosyltransferase [Bacteroidetes bacterium]|nr:glycosyltransferase [Bacteroidota bacterium]